MVPQVTRKRSMVNYTMVENTFATRAVCLKVPHGGCSIKSHTTTNLVNDLKLKHPEEYKAYDKLKVNKEKEINSY